MSEEWSNEENAALTTGVGWWAVWGNIANVEGRGVPGVVPRGALNTFISCVVA